MSQWLQIGVEIQHDKLHVFQRACESLNISFSQETLELNDQQGRGHGNLVRNNNGTLRLYTDVDGRYNSITQRLGSGCDLLMQRYSEYAIETEMAELGGSVIARHENQDGSLVLSIAV